MSLRKYILPAVIFCFFALIGIGCQSESKQNTQKELDTAVAIDKDDSYQDDCSFCGMPTQQHPKWRVQAFFENGTQSFCSPKCFFLYRHQQKTVPDSVWAMDYYDVTLFDASKGYFVTGSDVLGPMGHDLIPFAKAKAAQEFAQDHAGKQIIPFLEVDSLVIFGL